MLTGMLAVRNIVLGERNDLWSVNVDQEYHEEIHDEADRLARQVGESIEGVLGRVFLKLDRVAFALSMGTIGGFALFLATLILLVKGGDVVGPTLELLGQYLPGYSVTATGSVIGLLYGFVMGFGGGWAFAFLRNGAMFLYAAIIHRRAEFELLKKLNEYF
jgi:hypothetical protein